MASIYLDCAIYSKLYFRNCWKGYCINSLIELLQLMLLSLQLNLNCYMLECVVLVDMSSLEVVEGDTAFSL